MSSTASARVSSIGLRSPDIDTGLCLITMDLRALNGALRRLRHRLCRVDREVRLLDCVRDDELHAGRGVTLGIDAECVGRALRADPTEVVDLLPDADTE